MKTCKYCGSELSDNVIKCKYCGEYVEDNVKKEQKLSTMSLNDGLLKLWNNKKNPILNNILILLAIYLIPVNIIVLLISVVNMFNDDSAVRATVYSVQALTNVLGIVLCVLILILCELRNKQTMEEE